MPQLGESVTEGTIGKWLVKPGESVKKYQPIAEVITDKVNAEIPAPADGVIEALTVAEGAIFKLLFVPSPRDAPVSAPRGVRRGASAVPDG